MLLQNNDSLPGAVTDSESAAVVGSSVCCLSENKTDKYQ